MARLPQTGSDEGVWGEILNDFLSQVHKSDGTLKNDVVTADAIAPGSITKTDVGLGNVDNTADADKPISATTQTALNTKLTASNNLNDIANAPSARANLGLGTAATMTPGTLAADSAFSGTYASRTSVLRASYGGLGFAVLGDSITSHNGGTPTQPAAPGDNWHTQMAGTSGGRLRWMGGAAAGGYTVQQIRDNLLASVLALSPAPSIGIVLGGTNNAGSGSFNLATDIAALIQIYDGLEAGGIKPVACTIPPRGDSTSANQKADQWNAAVRAVAFQRGYDLLDFHSVLTDPATGGFKSGYAQSDNIHPGWLGHRVMGEYAAGILGSRVPNSSIGLIRAQTDFTDICGAGMFAADSNADGISDGWSSFSGAGFSFSRSQDADGIWWQRITVPNTATGAALLQRNVTGAPVVPGHLYEFSARVRASGLTAIATSTSSYSAVANVAFYSQTSGGTYLGGIGAGAGVHLDTSSNGNVAWQRAICPAGTLRFAFNIQTGGIPPSGSFYVEVAQMSMRDLTILGIT